MALGATIYVFNIELADSDRGVYQPLQLRVAVYTHKDGGQLAARLSLERIHRVEALELYALDRVRLADLAAKLARRMEFSLTVAERHIYLSLGGDTISSVVERIVVGRP